MKAKSILLCVVSMALVAASAQAIDCGARMIDRVNLDLAHLDEVDSIGGSILGETVFDVPRRDWAILFGGGLGTISPDYADDVNFWHISLGLKYYLFPVTSLSFMGKYERYDAPPGHRDAKGASVQLKHRFLPAEAPLSPYVVSTLTARTRSTFSAPGVEGSFSEVLFNVGAGAEFAMRNDLSFAFEIVHQLAEASENGAEDLDGVLVTVSMVYYWSAADVADR
jgi:hypothetical protein